MKNEKPMRGTLFGGFNKKDVAAYIEELSTRSAEYKAENDRLWECSDECESVKQTLAELRQEHDSMLAEFEAAKAELEELRAEKARLEEENAALSAELSSARENAEVFNAAKERLAALEVESSRRSIELERDAKANADRILSEVEENVSELRAALLSLYRDTLRMKEGLHGQLAGLESSIDDLAALSQSKQEYLGKFTRVSSEQGG